METTIYTLDDLEKIFPFGRTKLLKLCKENALPVEVSELLGHSQVSTTYEYYIKTSNEDKRNLVNQLDAIAS